MSIQTFIDFLFSELYEVKFYAQKYLSSKLINFRKRGVCKEGSLLDCPHRPMALPHELYSGCD